MNDRKSSCVYCGYDIPLGSPFVNYKLEGVRRHLDCAAMHRNEAFYEKRILSRYLRITTAERPKVLIASEVFRKLVKSSIENFPYQSVKFTIGYCDEEIIRIGDFCGMPLLKSVMQPGELSKWEIDKSEQAKRSLEDILKEGRFNGYIHCHDSPDIGISDLFYDWFLSDAIPEGLYGKIAVHVQFDFFNPSMRELILLNHKRFNGSKFLITPAPDYSAEESLTRYLQPQDQEDARLIKEVKDKVRRTILSNSKKHIAAFSTVLTEVKGYDSDKDEEVIMDGLMELVKGKIRQLPLVIA